MTFRLETWSAAVAQALTKRASAVEPSAPRQWSFALNDLPELPIEARLTPEWFQLAAPLPSSFTLADCGFEILAANAALPAGLRLCTVDRDPRLWLRADLPLHEDLPLGQLVERLCAAVAAIGPLLATGAADINVQSPINTAESGSGDCDLQRLCSEAGWPFTARDDGSVMVELDVPGAFRQAVLERGGENGVAVSVRVLAEAPTSSICARAVVGFVLAITGAVRMVSAVEHREGATAGVDFSIRFEQPPAAEDLAHAFAALSVGWRSGGREVAVLAQDERVARLYLATSGDPHIENEERNAHST